MVNMMSEMGEDLMVGDPAKVAQLVMKVVDMDEPPLHLLAGSDAFLSLRRRRHIWLLMTKKIGSSVCLLTLTELPT